MLAIAAGTVQYTLTLWRYISSMPLGQQTSSSSRYSTVHTHPLEVHLQHATGAADQQYQQVQYSTHLPSGGTSPACHWGSRPAVPAGTVHTYPLEVHLKHATGAADQQYQQVQYSTHLPSGGTSPACHWGSRYSTVHTYPLEVHLQHATGAADQQYQQVQYTLTLWRYISSMPLGQQTSSTSRSAMLRFNRNRFVDDLSHNCTNQDRLKGQCHEVFDFSFFS